MGGVESLGDLLRPVSAALAAAFDDVGVPGALARAIRRRPEAPPPAPAPAVPDGARLAVLAGPGVLAFDAVDALHRLANRAGIGVANTWGAKGVYPWDDGTHAFTAAELSAFAPGAVPVHAYSVISGREFGLPESIYTLDSPLLDKTMEECQRALNDARMKVEEIEEVILVGGSSRIPRVKEMVKEIEVPQGMGLIVRTAGANRTKVEIKRDYEYLLRLWDTVRELTLQSNAPALVYEEGSLIKRAIRDLYNKDIEDIVVDGDEGYREAKDFMRLLMPSHVKAVQAWREPQPIFARYGVEQQLDAMFSPTVPAKRYASWVTMTTARRRSWLLIARMSMPSSFTAPTLGS